MTVLVFEDNLMWSSKMVQTLKALGHVPVVRTKPEIGEVKAQSSSTWAPSGSSTSGSSRNSRRKGSM